ncbi:MAG: exonuclease domain-containing protein, partial [Alphaproteobacteria bacterium]
MERQIVLDTETTGLDPKQGDRIVEIGALEIVDLIPTGSTFQVYVD